MPDITYDVGRVSFVMKGAWNLATAYEKLDAVSYNGSLYIAKQDVPGGTAITNTTYWVLAVEKGDQGETGNGIASIAKTGTAGNVDTYTITYTDGTTTTFTVTNGGVTTVNGRTGDVTGLAEEDGSYPLLNAGTADNLTPYSEDSGATQDIPFIAQGTGCGNGESVVDTGSYLQFKKKLGNTVGVNQFCDVAHMSAQTLAGVTWTPNADGSVTSSGTATADSLYTVGSWTPTAGHKYLIYGMPPGDGTSWYMLVLGDSWEIASAPRIISIENSGNSRNVMCRVLTGKTAPTQKWFPEFRDLTLRFGSNDRIPSDLLSHPENWGRYYAGSLDYNAGTLDSADGSVLKSIGRNCWDEETEIGTIDIYGQNAPYAYELRTKNYIPVIPNTEYFFKKSGNSQLFYYDSNKTFISYKNTSANTTFTTPSNCFFVRFRCGDAYGTTYNHDITISLYYSGESGYDQYYPFSVLAEVDTGSEVLMGNGDDDADTKLPDGTITRKWTTDTIAVTSIYERATNPNCDFAVFAVSTAFASDVARDCRFSKYGIMNNSSHGWDAALIGEPRIYQSPYQIAVAVPKGTTLAQAQALLDGATFMYRAATPTTEQGTAFAENIPCDDFGSMYWTQTKGIPQGNEIFYPVDYKASIDTLYNRVGGDMSKIVTEDEYPEAPSSDGTYVLKATVSGGTKTYAWVAE